MRFCTSTVFFIGEFADTLTVYSDSCHCCVKYSCVNEATADYKLEHLGELKSMCNIVVVFSQAQESGENFLSKKCKSGS
jgi:hypothetical protein